ncbi:hypothetical protein BZA77DRAFT_294800 [Pyronema omphalodes]|nr:hypothetical protein BZA77DRAFT_294800 [Pyronema omphalodes]
MVHPIDENRPEKEVHDGIRFRYGGPRKANAKIIEKAALVKRPAKNLYMNAADLKNMAVVCKEISQHTLRYMHMHLTWVLREDTGAGSILETISKTEKAVATSTNLQCVRKVDMSRCMKMQSLMLLRNMPNITKLGIDFTFTDNVSEIYFTCEDFERLYGDTILPKLEEITITPVRMEDLQGILSKARSLERMHIVLPTQDITHSHDGLVEGMQQQGRNHVLAQTVGKQLKELFIYYGLSNVAWPLAIPCLDDRRLWPELKVVQYQNILDRITRPDPDPICGRINLLKSVYRQHVRQSREFIHWLSSANGPDADDIYLMTDDDDTLLSTDLSVIEEDDFMQLEIDALEEIVDLETRVTLFYERPIKFRLGGLHWKGTGGGTNFPLRDFALQLASLCRDSQLRALDIDASRLMSPPPNRPYAFNDEELCTVNKHLSWINVPQLLPGRNPYELMLRNLRELTLRNLYINSKAEFKWFMSLSSIKTLEKLRIYGLVWHHGYHRWAMNRIPDTWNEKAWDSHGNGDGNGDDDENASDTDSNFGVDIRFSSHTDEELRTERLRVWITERLLAEARRVGGACRDVVIRDLVTNGKPFRTSC